MTQVIPMVAIAYLAIGIFFTMAGPAARLLKREGASLARDKRVPTWKRVAYCSILAIFIVLGWPVLVIAARRDERCGLTSMDSWEPASDEPTAKAAARIAEIEAGPPRCMTLHEFQRIGHDLAWFDAAFIKQAMAKRGYLVAMATTGTGDSLPVKIEVASEIGQPLLLTEVSPNVWRFSTCDDSWMHLAGRAGDACVRDGIVVSVFVTMMS
ncbi:MAG: hypothetical protein BWZ07_01562 [Alphaproteobacteria bacterium ADurb.BinA280]|jgi:hypothetical protein|nr:hypothetical protein [Xanthomonadales bacterium]MCC6506754.1 hypothetical protein [Aquimonas sp.]OPZ12090.1 MAG: hypothetical protein BWZ07_01562 [Alphaproteobacteria bacterium ADurb.BinA280]